MTEEDVLIEVFNSLDKIKIPYALTGGLAVSFYGIPRSTIYMLTGKLDYSKVGLPI